MAVNIKSPLLSMRIYDRSLALVGDVFDYVSLETTIGINEAGVARLIVPENHYINDEIDARYLCEVYFTHDRNTGQAWIFAGELERTLRKASNGRIEYVYIFAGLLSILQQSIVAWKAGTDNRSTFASEDIHDIIEYVIQYNHFFGTTALGRERTSDNDHVQYVSSGTPGSPETIDYSCAWRNVYDVVLDLAEAAGYEFEAELDTAFNRVLFQLDYDRLGVARTGITSFSEENGTVLNYEIVTNRNDYKTVAIIGGGNQAENRDVEVVTSAYYSAASNNAELFVDQRQTSDATHLQTAGQAALAQSKRRSRYTVALARQVINRFHPNRADLWLGDTIRWTFSGLNLGYRIIGITITAKGGLTNMSIVIEE